MPDEILITKDDVRVVMSDWLDQPGSECSDLSDLEACVEYFFDRLQRLTKVED